MKCQNCGSQSASVSHMGKSYCRAHKWKDDTYLQLDAATSSLNVTLQSVRKEMLRVLGEPTETPRVESPVLKSFLEDLLWET